MIWFIIPAVGSSRTNHDNNALALIVLLQYIPRLYLIYPLSSQIIKATGVVTKTAWAGAAYNLLLYMLASHVCIMTAFELIPFAVWAYEWSHLADIFHLFSGQVLGAAWYLLSVDRYTSCWKSICRKEKSPVKCVPEYLSCDDFDGDRQIWASSTNVFQSCNPNDNTSTFNYGIFENAMTKNVVSSNFVERYCYCLWWGLQQLR